MYCKKKKDIFILDIREKERQRIAMEIHDVTIQHLIHLIHKVELSSLYIDKDPVKAKFELAAVENELHRAVDEMRSMVLNLHPIPAEDIELKDAIEGMIIRLKDSTHFEFDMDIENVSCENKVTALSIYRIINECCNNAIKHSRGDRINVSLKVKNKKYIIKISDNGIGFDSDVYEKKILANDEGHFGFLILKERIQLLHGKLNLDSSEEGTVFTFEIPVNSGYK